ncbi:hypothetical protein D3C85_1057010 [compost metagenome]
MQLSQTRLLGGHLALSGGQRARSHAGLGAAVERRGGAVGGLHAGGGGVHRLLRLDHGPLGLGHILALLGDLIRQRRRMRLRVRHEA